MNKHLKKARKIMEELEYISMHAAECDIRHSAGIAIKELKSLIKRLEAYEHYKQQEIKIILPERKENVRQISNTCVVVFGD
jgi:hypothetical protein